MRRYQKPSPKRVKIGRQWVWKLQYRDLQMVPRTKVLGTCEEMTRPQAELATAEILRPINSEITREKPVPVSFGEFVRDVYLPVSRGRWKRSTAMTTEPRINLHLVRALDERPIGNITRQDLQAVLEEKAQTLSFSVVHHLRWDLRSIFGLALSEGAVHRDPTPRLFTPVCRPAKPRRTLAVEDVRKLWSVLSLRERLATRLAILEGMRPGEILALRWRNVAGPSIKVEARLYKTDLDSPKTSKSARLGGLSLSTMEDLQAWRELVPDTSPDAFVFPSEKGTPITQTHFWSRYMLPKLKEAGLDWATFQVMRRTNASLGRKAGIDDKVAADQRGHGIGVSLDVYASSDLAQKIEAVRKLEAAVME
jgi:integrase